MKAWKKQCTQSLILIALIPLIPAGLPCRMAGRISLIPDAKHYECAGALPLCSCLQSILCTSTAAAWTSKRTK